MYHGSKFSGTRYVVKYMMTRPASCPYWLGHAESQNRLLGDLLFDKWNKRPNTAYKLYWHLHPKEYTAANQFYKRNKKN